MGEATKCSAVAQLLTVTLNMEAAIDYSRDALVGL
jgi:hypothetical protein